MSDRAMQRWFLALVLWVASASAWAEPNVRVAVCGKPPFFVRLNGREADGICPAIWEACATVMKVDSDYTVCSNIEESLERIRQGQADLALGPIRITAARIRDLDFTVPFHSINLAGLIRLRDASLFERIRPLLTSAALIGGATLITVIAGVGVAMWLLERRRNPGHFPQAAREGMEEGIWFAITTATTVGYGDRFPVTRMGRLVAATWMLVAGIAFSTVTALLATALTLSHLPAAQSRHFDDLTRARLAVIKGSLSEEVMVHQGNFVYRADDLDQAIRWLEGGRVEMVISTTVVLNYHLRMRHLESSYRVQELIGRTQLLSFALPHHSPLTNKINAILLTLQEEGRLEHISEAWINQLDPDASI